MRENQLRSLWRAGHAATCCWLTIPSAFTAELMAHAGFDSLTIDLQHGLIGYETAVSMLQAISTTPVTPLARVPWNEPGIIMKLLDAGAAGIICPMINSRQEAEAFVAACRYPPAGQRSYGPRRAMLYAGADYPEHANAYVLAIAMIETASALAQIDEILDVPGLDAIYVGPADLSLALGVAQRVDQDDPIMVAALDRILQAARRRGIPAGLHTGSAAFAAQMFARGWQLATVQTDAAFLEFGAQTALSQLRGSAAVQRSGPY